MGKLAGRGLASRLGPPRSRLQTPRDKRAAPAPRRRASHKWYYTARWKRLRWDVLVEANFTCQRCGRIEADTSRLIADHIRPHRGDPELFWDRENLQCLCDTCHSGDKQREEQRGGAI